MEQQDKLISVIVPCYNMERFITATIQSVVHQTYSHWELLIVDDTSTDHTAELIRRQAAQDPRIHLMVKQQHSGIADSRNHCIDMAKGSYLAFLDADDVWHPEKLERQLDFMEKRQIGFSYTSYDCIDEEGRPLSHVIKATTDLDHDAYLHNTIIGCSTVMLNAEKVGKVVVPDFRTSEDTATWLNILIQGHIAHAIDTPLTSYRIRKKSASSNKLKAASDLWKVYRKQERLSWFKAMECFLCYAFNAIKKRL